MHYLHTKVGLAHLDIKLDNFMFETRTKRVRMIDFGMAEPIYTLGEYTKGTFEYLPPEV